MRNSMNSGIREIRILLLPVCPTCCVILTSDISSLNPTLLLQMGCMALKVLGIAFTHQRSSRWPTHSLTSGVAATSHPVPCSSPEKYSWRFQSWVHGLLPGQPEGLSTGGLGCAAWACSCSASSCLWPCLSGQGAPMPGPCTPQSLPSNYFLLKH